MSSSPPIFCHPLPPISQGCLWSSIIWITWKNRHPFTIQALPLGEIVKQTVSLVTKYNLRHASSVITVTKELSEFLRDLGVKDITVIPNGVDTRVLKPMPMQEAKNSLGLAGPVLGYVGSLEHWVDLETVVQALPSLDVTLLVVGPGLFTDYGSMIKKMAEDLGVAKRVVFTGAVKYEELSRYISAMDIGLNPLKMMKKNEYAAGGKVFNYLACGRPVLSSRMISLERLLGDEIYYYDDVASFVEQVKMVLHARSDEQKLRLLAEKYDWRRLAAKDAFAWQASLRMRWILRRSMTASQLQSWLPWRIWDFAQGEAVKMIRNEETTLSGRLQSIQMEDFWRTVILWDTGIAQVYEIVEQLRGEAGNRQVESAR